MAGYLELLGNVKWPFEIFGYECKVRANGKGFSFSLGAGAEETADWGAYGWSGEDDGRRDLHSHEGCWQGSDCKGGAWTRIMKAIEDLALLRFW